MILRIALISAAVGANPPDGGVQPFPGLSTETTFDAGVMTLTTFARGRRIEERRYALGPDGGTEGGHAIAHRQWFLDGGLAAFTRYEPHPDGGIIAVEEWNRSGDGQEEHVIRDATGHLERHLFADGGLALEVEIQDGRYRRAWRFDASGSLLFDRCYETLLLSQSSRRDLPRLPCPTGTRARLFFGSLLPSGIGIDPELFSYAPHQASAIVSVACVDHRGVLSGPAQTWGGPLDVSPEAEGNYLNGKLDGPITQGTSAGLRYKETCFGSDGGRLE